MKVKAEIRWGNRSQGMPKSASRPPEARKGAWDRLLHYGYQKDPILWSRTSGLQHSETIECCCLSHPVYGIWLWQQPQETNTPGKFSLYEFFPFSLKATSILCFVNWNKRWGQELFQGAIDLLEVQYRAHTPSTYLSIWVWRSTYRVVSGLGPCTRSS